MTTIQKNRDILAEQKRELFHALEAHDYDSLTVLLDDSPELIDKTRSLQLHAAAQSNRAG